MEGNRTYGDSPYGDTRSALGPSNPATTSIANEFDVWFNGVVVLDYGSPEFDVWFNGVPYVDSPSFGVIVTAKRRRAAIF